MKVRVDKHSAHSFMKQNVKKRKLERLLFLLFVSNDLKCERKQEKCFFFLSPDYTGL